jgi:hypothetical protein
MRGWLISLPYFCRYFSVSVLPLLVYDGTNLNSADVTLLLLILLLLFRNSYIWFGCVQRVVWYKHIIQINSLYITLAIQARPLKVKVIRLSRLKDIVNSD